MINVDISNLWTCVSLPELLGSEQEIFDAHNLLRGSEPDSPDFHGWLDAPAAVSERLLSGVSRASGKICDQSDILVVCGSGGAYQGARAAIDLYCGPHRNLLGSKPEILFTGESLSARQWVELGQLLEERNFSLHILSADGTDIASNITARGLRWLMERKYGPKAKERISAATMVGTPVHKMAQEEGYELFPLPKEPGGADSCLTAGALLPMAAAGIDPMAVWEGAVQSRKALDIRAFENPVWLYAAARSVLARKGIRQELLCIFDHNLAAFGHWWKLKNWRSECRGGSGLCVQTAMYPGDLEAMDSMAASGSSPMFQTMLHFAPAAKKVPVEMDWKDYDGLGFLSGRTLDYVQTQLMTAAAETHNFAGVPVLDIDGGELIAESIGELFGFFELSSALTACILGADPFAAHGKAAQSAAMEAMGGPASSDAM